MDTVFVVLVRHEPLFPLLFVCASIDKAKERANQQIERYLPSYSRYFKTPDPGPKDVDERLAWWNDTVTNYCDHQTLITYHEEALES